MWFDSHCHLDFPCFDDDRAEVVSRASQASVTELFIPGVEPAQWARLPSISKEYGFAFGVGHHPDYLAAQEPTSLAESLGGLSERALRLGASAIGETGLDRRVAERGGAPLDLQEECLAAHLRSAKELELPLVLHVVGVHGAALKQLERYGPFAAGGVLHSYSGSAELLARYSRLNLMFSFSGSMTRPSAKKAQRSVQLVADEHLLLETDAPDQLPAGGLALPPTFGGAEGVGVPTRPAPSRNEPAALIAVAARVAELRGVSREHVLGVASANARRLFSGR